MSSIPSSSVGLGDPSLLWLSSFLTLQPSSLFSGSGFRELRSRLCAYSFSFCWLPDQLPHLLPIQPVSVLIGNWQKSMSIVTDKCKICERNHNIYKVVVIKSSRSLQTHSRGTSCPHITVCNADDEWVRNALKRPTSTILCPGNKVYPRWCNVAYGFPGALLLYSGK